MKFWFVFAVVIFQMSMIGYSQDYKAKDRVVTEINWNAWRVAPDGITQEWFSRGVNFFGMYDVPIGNSPISIAPGIGIAVDNVYHNGQFLASDTMTQIVPISDSVNYKSNKLNTVYLEAPIELRFRTKPNDKGRSFKIAIGIRGGLLLASHTRYKGEGTTFGYTRQEIKIKQFDVPNLDNIRYGATFRIGYGPVNLQAYYGLSSLFEAGQGPEMIPFHVGLSFNGL